MVGLDGFELFTVSFIHSRFSDEILPIIIGLRTPIQEPEELKNITKRLSLSLELRAIGSSLSRSGPPHSLTETSPARLEDVVWKGTLVAQEEPIIVKNQAADNDYGGPCMTAIWEINAILSLSLHCLLYLMTDWNLQ